MSYPHLCFQDKKLHLWSLNHINISTYLHSAAFLLKYAALECNPCYHLKVSVFCAWVSEPSLYFKCCAKISDTTLTGFFTSLIHE